MNFVVRLTNVRGVAVAEEEIAKLHTTLPCLGGNHGSVCVGEPVYLCAYVCVMCVCVCLSGKDKMEPFLIEVMNPGVNDND